MGKESNKHAQKKIEGTREGGAVLRGRFVGSVQRSGLWQ